MSICCTALRSAILTSIFFPLGSCLANRTKFCMERKILPCLQNASQHVPVYLQQFPSYSNHNCKKSPFLRTQAFIFCLPWGRPCGNHAKRCMNEKTIQCLPNPSLHVPIYLQPFPSYVAWMERQFNACQTPRSMYPSIFNSFPVMLHGWKDNSMLAKPLAVCTYLSSKVTKLYDA